jgi:hypothetical protein
MPIATPLSSGQIHQKSSRRLAGGLGTCIDRSLTVLSQCYQRFAKEGDKFFGFQILRSSNKRDQWFEVSGSYNADILSQQGYCTSTSARIWRCNFKLTRGMLSISRPSPDDWSCQETSVGVQDTSTVATQATGKRYSRRRLLRRGNLDLGFGVGTCH